MNVRVRRLEAAPVSEGGKVDWVRIRIIEKQRIVESLQIGLIVIADST